MYADGHVHFRDFEQKEKETVKHGLEVARDSGVDIVADMPNTKPAIFTLELAKERLALAREANVPEVFYGLYMGLTKDREQIKTAVRAYREFFPHVIGMKLYAGHSVENLGVIFSEDQEIVYETLALEGYNGILVVHAEKESKMHHSFWNPYNPRSHCFARPEISEIESVKDQIAFAFKYRFGGKLHIAHISSPTAVRLVNEAKRKGLDISCGICPHHFIFDWGKMLGADGIHFKMNPPLRSPESRNQMFDSLRNGSIDWIETDHAPHTLEQKVKDPYMSGIVGEPWWPIFDEYLNFHGFSAEQREDLMFNNFVKRTGVDVTRSTERKLVDRRSDYPFNPYKEIEKLLGIK